MQKIRIDYLDNPELQQYLSTKEPGEDCEITLSLSTISAGTESFEGNVESIIYDYEGEEMEVEPSLEEPVGINVFSDLDEELEEEPDLAAVVIDTEEEEM